MKPEGKRKLNTFLFLVGATVLNIVIMLALIIVGYVLLAKFGDPEKTAANQIYIILLFVGSIGASWFIYSRIVKIYLRQVEKKKSKESEE